MRRAVIEITKKKHIIAKVKARLDRRKGKSRKEIKERKGRKNEIKKFIIKEIH